MSMIVDIETAPIDDVSTYLEPVTAPANYKDPEKIAAYVAEAAKTAADRAGLDPDLCRIVTLGYLKSTDTSGEPRLLTCRNEHEEKVAVTAFWGDSHGHRLITFNGLKFDAPVLMRRSLYLGVQGRTLNLDRYRTDDVDLWMKLSYNGVLAAHSLSFYAQRFGFPGDLEVTGADIARLVREGDYATIARHCRQDILWTKLLAQKMGYWPTTVTPVHEEVF